MVKVFTGGGGKFFFLSSRRQRPQCCCKINEVHVGMKMQRWWHLAEIERGSNWWGSRWHGYLASLENIIRQCSQPSPVFPPTSHPPQTARRDVYPENQRRGRGGERKMTLIARGFTQSNVKVFFIYLVSFSPHLFARTDLLATQNAISLNKPGERLLNIKR